MKAIRNLSILCLLLIASTATFAQTPDGDPPSEEDVCDGLDANLYGLCNAYCEAMDCDSANPNASERACERKYQQYMALNNGNPPPCEGVICPCDSEEAFPVFFSFGDGQRTVAACATEAGLLASVTDGFGADAEVLVTDEGYFCQDSSPGSMMITMEQAVECAAILQGLVDECPCDSVDPSTPVCGPPMP